MRVRVCGGRYRTPRLFRPPGDGVVLHRVLSCVTSKLIKAHVSEPFSFSARTGRNRNNHGEFLSILGYLFLGRAGYVAGLPDFRCGSGYGYCRSTPYAQKVRTIYDLAMRKASMKWHSLLIPICKFKSEGWGKDEERRRTDVGEGRSTACC